MFLQLTHNVACSVDSAAGGAARFMALRPEQLFAQSLNSMNLFRIREEMSHAPLRRLLFRDNDLRAGGAEALVEVILGCSGVSLDELNLENNNIGELGATAIARLLGAVPASPITRLIISRNRLGDAGTATILRTITESVKTH
jgi:hypothetical protein